jgi:hypothetical protein
LKEAIAMELYVVGKRLVTETSEKAIVRIFLHSNMFLSVTNGSSINILQY